jgi:hypothetical protein
MSLWFQHESLKWYVSKHAYFVPINQMIHANMHMILLSKEKDFGVDICWKNKSHWETYSFDSA